MLRKHKLPELEAVSVEPSEDLSCSQNAKGRWAKQVSANPLTPPFPLSFSLRDEL